MRANHIESIQKRLTGRCILLVTAIPTELATVLEEFESLSGRSKIIKAQYELTYYIGRLGAMPAVAMMSGVGSTGRDGSALSISSAIERWHPCAIVMVGIAFGKDPIRQGIGDVLVSSQVICYEPQRLGTPPVDRGSIVESGTILLDRFRNAAVDWTFQSSEEQRSRLHFGPILSGEKLVDSPSFKADLFTRYPQAIGGEMEAAGLYAAASRAQTEWIVVKAISDWADGTKTDAHHRTAARAAVSLVKHVFSTEAVVASLARDPGKRMPAANTPDRRQPQAEKQNAKALSDREPRPHTAPEPLSSISERDDTVSNLLTELTAADSPRVLVVSGSVGSGAVSVTRCALSEWPGRCVSIDLSALAPEPLFGQSSHEVALLHRVAAGIGQALTPVFVRAWEKYEKCFNVAHHVRTMVEQSGYDLCRSLQSLDVPGNAKRRGVDPLQILRRVLWAEEEIEILVKPQKQLLDALFHDIAALPDDRIILHFHDPGAIPEAPLVSVIHNLAVLNAGSVRLQMVVSLDAHPFSYPLLRQCPIFHVSKASRSAVLRYLEATAAGVGEQEHTLDLEFISRLSVGSLAVAEFLRNHVRLVKDLKDIELRRGSEGPIRSTAAEAWCLLAVAYHVTPSLLSEALGITEAEATSIVEEIPDECDGGRRLPTDVAGAVIAASPAALIARVNTFLLNHFRKVSSDTENNWSAPSPTHLALGFHSAWHSGTMVVLDRCFVMNFRTSLPLCAQLHAALSRLQAIGGNVETISEQVAARLKVIERLDAGCCSDDRVVLFFEDISKNATDFSRAERAVANYQLGHAYHSAGEQDLAAAALESAVELDAEYHNAWSLLGIVSDRQDRTKAAVIALREAIKLKGDYEVAHFNLGVIMERQVKLYEAAKCYVAAIRCDPGFYEAAHNLSNVLLKVELFEEAAYIATYMGDIAPELRVEPIFNIANALASLGELRKARRLFRFCLNERTDSRFAYNLGLAYASLGQWAAAMDVLKTAGKLAKEENCHEIRAVAISVHESLKRGEGYQWRGQSMKTLLSPPMEAELKRDMRELFGMLARRGYGGGFKGIRRTISEVAAHIEAAKYKIRMGRDQEIGEAAKARKVRQEAVLEARARVAREQAVLEAKARKACKKAEMATEKARRSKESSIDHDYAGVPKKKRQQALEAEARMATARALRRERNQGYARLPSYGGG